MHIVDIVRNMMKRSDVDVTEDGIVSQILEVKRMVDMIEAGILAGPSRIFRSTEQIPKRLFPVKYMEEVQES